jgi:hypothetical protein
MIPSKKKAAGKVAVKKKAKKAVDERIKYAKPTGCGVCFQPNEACPK